MDISSTNGKITEVELGNKLHILTIPANDIQIVFHNGFNRYDSIAYNQFGFKNPCVGHATFQGIRRNIYEYQKPFWYYTDGLLPNYPVYFRDENKGQRKVYIARED